MALHALLHLSMHASRVSSIELAECMGANAAQLRRTLGGLREAGIVSATKGRGGGWCMAQPLEALTLRDVHVALNESALLTIGHHREETECLVERAVNAALEAPLRETEVYLLERFASISHADLARDFQRRMKRHAHHHTQERKQNP